MTTAMQRRPLTVVLDTNVLVKVGLDRSSRIRALRRAWHRQDFLVIISEQTCLLNIVGQRLRRAVLLTAIGWSDSKSDLLSPQLFEKIRADHG